MIAWRVWTAGPGRVQLAAALRATGLRSRNWTMDAGASPYFAIYEEGDTYVGCVEIGELGNLRIPPDHLAPRATAKRQRQLLEGLITVFASLADE